MTAWAPKSEEQEDQTAPIFAEAKKLIIVSGQLGRNPTITSPPFIPNSRK